MINLLLYLLIFKVKLYYRYTCHDTCLVFQRYNNVIQDRYQWARHVWSYVNVMYYSSSNYLTNKWTNYVIRTLCNTNYVIKIEHEIGYSETTLEYSRLLQCIDFCFYIWSGNKMDIWYQIIYSYVLFVK